LPGYPPYLGNTGAGYISAVIINVGIVNNGSTVYNIHHPGMRHIVVINIRAVDISLRSAYPVIIGHMITIAE
jgi:hypothetical protein